MNFIAAPTVTGNVMTATGKTNRAQVTSLLPANASINVQVSITNVVHMATHGFSQLLLCFQCVVGSEHDHVNLTSALALSAREGFTTVLSQLLHRCSSCPALLHLPSV
jgi:hypothetical protein